MDFIQRGEKFARLSHKNKEFVLKNVSKDNIVFLSASHSARHLRNNVVKSEKGECCTPIIIQDIMTLLNLKYNKKVVGIMYKTGNELDDPNFTEDSNYRNKAHSILKDKKILTIDFHNMHFGRDYDIDIGVNNFANVKNDKELVFKLRDKFLENKLNVKVDNLFKADPVNNFSRTCAELNDDIKSIQLEMNFKLLFKKEDYTSYIYSVVSFLDDYIQSVLNTK